MPVLGGASAPAPGTSTGTLIPLLIFPSLPCDLVKDNSRGRTEIQALDHAEHWNGDAEFTALDCEVTDSAGLTTEPDGDLRVRVIPLMEDDRLSPFDVR